ncbi:avidin-like isoform X2 [Lepisosteus oculatus]|uniref:avidin-like isoform X2 n=1 Tax=Lepisosteus oculatus TaxID=7918 RepID=UPI00371755A1
MALMISAALPVFFFSVWTLCVEGTGCNMTGVWVSDLGSVLKLAVLEDSELRGLLTSSVETVKGAAGSMRQGNVQGILNRGPRPSFAFSVAWDGGSTSSWVGQCFVQEDGRRVLKTLWMLRSFALSSVDNWKSTRMGEDTFYSVPPDE